MTKAGSDRVPSELKHRQALLLVVPENAGTLLLPAGLIISMNGIDLNQTGYLSAIACNAVQAA